ncbi:S4 domain-containing protein [Erysipelothrix sp. Poltava]|nr:S4 domain-containing protein [Erysipelothrix sp. Poltava]
MKPSFIKEPHLRLAQKELAKELTEVVFGKEGFAMAERVTNALFSGNVQELTVEQIRQVFADSASIEVSADENIVELLVNTKVCPSKREARQLIEGGAIRVNGEVVNDTDFVISKDNAIGKEVTVIRRGKKTYHIFNHTN